MYRSCARGASTVAASAPDAGPPVAGGRLAWNLLPGLARFARRALATIVGPSSQPYAWLKSSGKSKCGYEQGAGQPVLDGQAVSY